MYFTSCKPSGFMNNYRMGSEKINILDITGGREQADQKATQKGLYSSGFSRETQSAGVCV